MALSEMTAPEVQAQIKSIQKQKQDNADILSFLAAQSRTPIPQNVEYSIRDWGEKIRFGAQREVVLLTVDSEDVLDRILAIERIRGVMVARISPTAAALSEPIENWRTLEELRSLGVYLRD